jgi:hypothetical protein
MTTKEIEFINSITTVKGNYATAVALHITIGCTSYDSWEANGMDH